MMVSGGGDFGKFLNHEGKTPTKGIGTLWQSLQRDVCIQEVCDQKESPQTSMLARWHQPLQDFAVVYKPHSM